MAFSKARRLSDFIAADGTIPTAKFASGTITSAHIADTSITHADLHTDMNLTSKTVLVANASTGDSDTTAANTAFVQQEIAALVDSSPSALNTLNELAAALGDDANFSTTVTNSIATKLPLAGGTMTGTLAMGTNAITSTGTITAGKVLAGDQNSTVGDVLLQGLYGSGATVNIGSERSSGGVFLGYGVQPSTTTQHEFLSSTGVAVTQSAYVAADTHRWWTASSGSAVTVGSQVTTMTQRMTILANGNVGIGEASPGHRLHINGGDNNEARVRVTNTASGQASLDLDNSEGYFRTYTDAGEYRIYDQTDGTHRMVIDTDGNVGIGTDGPAAKLHVDGTASDGQELFRITSNGDVANNGYHWMSSSIAGSQSTNASMIHLIGVAENTRNSGYFGFHYTGAGSADNYLKFGGYAEDNLMVIKMNGKVGIGTTSPGSKLEVYNSTVAGNTQLHIHNNKSSDAAALRLEGARTSSNDAAQLIFANSGNVIARIDSVSSGDDGNIRFFTSASSTGSSVTQAMSIDALGHIDGPIAGARMSSYVQDSFHVGSERSNHSRYGFSSSRTYVDGGSSNYQGYVYATDNYFPPVFIPYSPHQVYRISASMYQLTGSTASGGATSRHYFGLAGYDENFNFIQVDGIGTYQYILASNTTVSTGSTLEMDVTMKGWQGSGGTNGNKMDQGTVYIRPLVLFNYQSAGGSAVLTGFNIQPAGTVADNDSNAGTNY